MDTFLKFLGLMFLVGLMFAIWPFGGAVLWNACAVAGLWAVARGK